MPCYEIRTVTVEFKAEHKDILIKAIENLGWGYREMSYGISTNGMTIDLEAQKVSVREYGYDSVNQLKRAYSTAVIEEVAKKKKWAIQKIAENKLRARRY